MEEGCGKVQRLEGLKEEEVKELATVLGSLMKRGLILLFGELGAGKTTFVKGLARGLGIDEGVVRSPTFVIMHVYEGKSRIYHFDLYRLESEEDLVYIGLYDALEEDGLVAVEWADLFPNVWKGMGRVEVSIKHEKERLRTVELRECGREGLVGESIEIWKGTR